MVASFGCGGSQRGDHAANSAPRGDTWLGQITRANLDADRAIDSGDAEKAKRALASVFDSPAPAGISPADRRAVLADACFRMSRLSEKSEALLWADRGLAYGQSDDVLTGNLLAARGRALESLDRAADAGRAYHAALVINEKLLDQALAK